MPMSKQEKEEYDALSRAVTLQGALLRDLQIQFQNIVNAQPKVSLTLDKPVVEVQGFDFGLTL